MKKKNDVACLRKVQGKKRYAGNRSHITILRPKIRKHDKHTSK